MPLRSGVCEVVRKCMHKGMSACTCQCYCKFALVIIIFCIFLSIHFPKLGLKQEHVTMLSNK